MDFFAFYEIKVSLFEVHVLEHLMLCTTVALLQIREDNSSDRFSVRLV